MATAVTTVHIGRQPVFDPDGGLYGYELLFRADAEATSSGIPGRDGDAATTTTILTAFSDFSGEDLLGDGIGFINLTRTFLVGESPVPFDPGRAVLEVLETVRVDDALVAGVQDLTADGHRLALDDFTWSEGSPRMLELAHIVKIDVLDRPWAEIESVVRSCRPYDVRLLAERVEDQEVLDRCRDLGFELFQGYHLGRPQTLSTGSLTPAQALSLQLITRLGEPETTAADVESLLRLDPALSYRLLRIANSASYGQVRTLSSLHDAVVIVGLARLRAWLVLVQLSGLTGSVEQLTDVLVVARTCELLAQAGDRVHPDVAFTLGLLHALAERLGTEPSELVRDLLSLDPDLDDALDGEPGPLRAVLEAVLDYQRKAGPRVRPGGPDLDVPGAYLSALAWATSTCRAAVE